MIKHEEFINNLEVGKRLKEIRITNGLTQEQMAEILKVTPNAIRDYEKGKYGISKAVMLRLRQNFNVSIDNLLFGEKTEPDKLMAMLQNASEENKMRVLTYLLVYYVAGRKKGSVKNIDLKQLENSLQQLIKDEQMNQ